MNLGRSPSPGRAALVLMLLALLVVVCTAVYLSLQRMMGSAERGEPDDVVRLRGKLIILLIVVLCAALLILVFVLGAYLVMRTGRAVSQKRVGGQPTAYVDAWSQYRLSEADIAAATSEERRDRPGSDRSDDTDEPPEGDSSEPESEG